MDQLFALSVIYTPSTTITDCPDPDDNKFLELAIETGATIVTGDKQLLNMN